MRLATPILVNARYTAAAIAGRLFIPIQA